MSMNYNKRPRCVRFSKVDSVVCSSTSPLEKLRSVMEWNSVWYTAPELSMMREEAKAICTIIRNSASSNSIVTVQLSVDDIADSNNNNVSVIQNDEERQRQVQIQIQLHHTRGLEKRICRERQRRRYMASKYILHAASQLQCTKKLAAVAQRCNAYATTIAVREGSRDFFDAYSDELRMLVTDDKLTTTTTTNNSNNNNNKRKHETENRERYGRNVRPCYYRGAQ